MALSAAEKSNRCVSLELDYVHEVYERIGPHLSYADDLFKDVVKKFMDNLEPGSIVADIGCGDGKHLGKYSNFCYAMGADCSVIQTKLTRRNGKEVILGTNLRLPFRTDSFDGALSIGVIHHLATKDRRILALRELTRILRVGGRVLITVRSQENEPEEPKDVLVPWYEVKNKKDEPRLIGQDSGEYDLEENNTTSDCDSMSLPSSDEEDNSEITLPPMSSDIGWIPESQSRSIDDESTKSVPNSISLIPITICYDYFRKAFRRLSSANSTDDDALEKLRRTDSAIPPSPSNSYEQKLNFIDCLSMKLSFSLQRLINDNYIELLNLEQPLNHQFENTGRHIIRPYIPPKQETSGRTFSHKNRLMRSLSDLYKNMPDLWSSKAAKSCSDLKSQTSADSSDSWKEKSNRLKRSRTTATCNSSFDVPRRMESIGEFEMTLTEADKIVNDFLSSSMSSIETLKNRESSLEFGPYNALSQSDITNGNMMPGCNSPVLGAQALEEETIDCNFGGLGNFAGASGNLEHFFATQLLGTQIKNHEEENSILQFEDSLVRDLEFSNEFDQDYYSLPKPRKSSIKPQEYVYVTEEDYTGHQPEHEWNKSKKHHRDSGRKQNWYNSDQFLDLSAHATIVELPEDQKSVEMRYFKTDFFQEEQNDLDDFRFDYSSARQVLSRTNIEDQFYNIHQNTDDFKASTFDPESHARSYTSERKDSKHNKRKSSLTSNEPLQVSRKHFDSSKKELNSESSTLKNTNIHQNFTPKNNPIQTCVEALGPFYDTEIEVSSIDSTLTSYYSMPELHNLSDLHKNYNVHVGPIANRVHSDTLKHINKLKGVLQHKIIKQLQDTAGSTMTTEFKESKSFVANCAAAESVERQSKLSKPSSQSGRAFRKHDSPIFKQTSGDTDMFERVNPLQAIADPITFHRFSRSKSITSTSESSQNVLCKKNTVHKMCSKSLDSLSEKQSRSIDAINEMLHFNCANCARYDGTDFSQLATQLRSLVAQKYSEDTIFENERKVKVNQISYSEKSVPSPCPTNVPSKEEVKHQPGKMDETASRSSESLENIEKVNMLDQSHSSNTSHENSFEVPQFQQEVGGAKFKYKLFNSTASATSAVKDTKAFKQPQPDIHKTKEHFFEEQRDFHNISYSAASSDVWKNEVPKCNPIHRVNSQMLETYHRRPSDPLKHEIKHVPCKGYSLDYDKNATVCDESFHDLYDFNLPSTSQNLTEFESCSQKVYESRSDSESTSSQIISHTKSPTRGSESVKIKRKNSAKPSDSHLDSHHSLNGNQRTGKPNSGKDNLPFEEIEALSDKNLPTEDDPPPKNVNYFYGQVEEEGAAVTMHRYHHFFEKSELLDLISDHVEDLHVLDFFHEHSHWCIIAEKVRVWTI